MTVANAHSMRGALVRPDWPQLTLDEVQEVLILAGFEHSDARLLWHSPRPLSAAAIVDLPDRRLFVKRHHQSVRTATQLQEEHGFIAHLHAHGAPVSRVLLTADGQSAIACGGWTYEMHEVGAGTDLYRDAVSWSPFVGRAHAVAAGRALAQFHEAARHYEAPARATRLLVSNDLIIRSAEPLAAVRRRFDELPALRGYLQQHDWQTDLARAIAPFHEDYLALAPRLDPLWTHNDWHASNLLWSDASAAATVQSIFDFGLSDRTTAVHGLATAIERNTIPWLDIHEGIPGAADFSLVTGLLEGYLGARSLTPLERAALPATLPLVHVGLALTEIDYFHGVTHSAENAELAYRAFLLGHCDWFLQPEGRALLEHIRRQLQTLP